MLLAMPLWCGHEASSLRVGAHHSGPKRCREFAISAGLRGISQSDRGRELAPGPTRSLHQGTGAGIGHLAHARTERLRATPGRRLFPRPGWLWDGSLQIVTRTNGEDGAHYGPVKRP